MVCIYTSVSSSYQGCWDVADAADPSYAGGLEGNVLHPQTGVEGEGVCGRVHRWLLGSVHIAYLQWVSYLSVPPHGQSVTVQTCGVGVEAPCNVREDPVCILHEDHPYHQTWVLVVPCLQGSDLVQSLWVEEVLSSFLGVEEVGEVSIEVRFVVATGWDPADQLQVRET